MTPEIEQRRTDDFYWFVKNYDDIYNRYGECWVAIRNKEIVGVFDNARVAIDEMNKISKPEERIIQHCNGDESGYIGRIG